MFVFAGQHDSVRANTGTDLNGVPTATADISKSKAATREQAALLIHETFHVYEKQAHPKWAANEAELFTYPLDDAAALALRRAETQMLVQALSNSKDDAHARCVAQGALEYRHDRFLRIGSDSAEYERGTKKPALTEEDFPAELIRQRGYATGQAYALLLDRFAAGWQSTIQGPLDEALRLRLSNCTAPVYGEDSISRIAAHDVAALVAARAQRKESFLAAPGWRIEIIAGKEPLWPQGFDPWNVQNLGNNEILHTRWAKVGNGAGAIEALDHPSLTEGVGPHPLFNGAKRYIITGLAAPPSINEKDGKVTIDAPGAKGTFTGASVTTTGQTVVVRLP